MGLKHKIKNPLLIAGFIFCLVALALALGLWRFDYFSGLAADYVEKRKHEKEPLIVSDAGRWQTLQEGLEWRQVTFHRQGRLLSIFNLMAIRADAARMELRMLQVPPAALPDIDMERLAEMKNGLCLMNANYFEPDFKVMGLLIVDGQTLSPLRKKGSIHHAVWLRRGVDVYLEHRANVNLAGVDQAFQAGPWLVTDGEAQTHFRHSDLVTRRSALGVDKKSRTVLLATDAVVGGMSLKELAEILARPESHGGFGLWRAINCDGGTSTQMILRHAKANFVIHSTVHVPVYIGVFPPDS